MVAYRAAAITTVTTGQTSASLPMPAGTTAGDLLVAYLPFGVVVSNFTFSAGWSQFSWSPLTDGTSSTAHCLWKIAGASEPNLDISWTTNSKGVYIIAAYSGVDGTTPFGNSGGLVSNTSGTTLTTPTVAAVGTTQWALASFHSRSSTSGNKAATYTPGAGMTERVDANNSGAASAPWINMEIADSNGAVTSGSHSYTATSTASESHHLTTLIYLNPASSTTQVTTTRATSWATGAAVTATRATSWAALAADIAARGTSWVTRAGTAATRATSWAARAAAAATRAATWNTAETIPTARPTTWNTLTEASTSRAATWNVAAALTAAATSRLTSWATRAATTHTTATGWDTTAQTSTSRPAAWVTRQTVTRAASATWNIAGTLATVATTRTASWAVAARATATRATTWAIAQTVTETTSTAWATRTVATAERDATWAARTLVGVTRSATWVTSQIVAAVRQALWGVATPTFKPRRLSAGPAEQPRLAAGAPELGRYAAGPAEQPRLAARPLEPLTHITGPPEPTRLTAGAAQ